MGSVSQVAEKLPWHHTWPEAKQCVHNTHRISLRLPQASPSGFTEEHGWVQTQSSILYGQVVCTVLFPPEACQLEDRLSHTLALKGYALRKA